MSVPIVAVTGHTTGSSPRPHILYTVNISKSGKETIVKRRYSEFLTLHDVLKDPFNLPPKRLLVTTFLPSAWADDALITERKAGLTEFLTNLVASSQYKYHTALNQFLLGEDLEQESNNENVVYRSNFDLEDALPSTLPRKAALTMAAMGTRPTGADMATMLAVPSTNGGESTATPGPGLHYGAYYPAWSASVNPPEKLDFSKFDILYFAFSMPNSSAGLNWESGGKAVLSRLVTSARRSEFSTKVVLSVGGWGGSYWFSQACSTAASRKTFVAALMDVVNTYGLDGLDLDWEYPNSPGAGNPYSPNDSANLLALMKALRVELGPSSILSAAVPHVPWLGPNGKPLTNVSEFATIMSFINIMNYDVWGASPTPGPNAPMANLCGTSKQPQASAQAALNQWKAAGFPVNKQSLGLALYGWVSQSTKTVLSGASLPTENLLVLTKEEGKTEEDLLFLNGAHPRSQDEAVTESAPTENGTTPEQSTTAVAAVEVPAGAETKSGEEVVVVANGEGEALAPAANLQKWWGQQIPFKTLVSSGALAKKSDGTYGGAGGFTMGWDNCSNTPYLFNNSQKTVVSYDDTWSLSDKTKLAKSNGMAGCFSWSLDQDDGYTLQNVVRKGLGK